MLAVVLALALGALGTLWWASTQLDNNRYRVENALSEILGHSVRIGQLGARWRALSPVLDISDLRIGHLNLRPSDDATLSATPTTQPAPIHLTNVQISIDLLASLRERAIRSHRIRVTGTSLVVTRTKIGQLQLVGFGGAAFGVDSANDLETLQRLVLAQPIIEFLDTQLLWRSPSTDTPPTPIGAMNVLLRGDDSTRTIEGKARFSQNGPPVRFLGKMTKPASDAPWVGNMAARFDDVSLGDIIQSIAATADFLPFQHSAGKVSGSITATYSHAEGIAIKATVDVVDAQIQPQFDATDTSDKSDSLLAFEHVRFDADISSRQFPSSGQEWEGHLSNVRIRHAGQTWPTKTVDIQIRSAPAPSSAVSGTTSGIPLPNTLSVSLLLDAFRVADLRRIASPYITRASVATLVSKTAATGLLRQVDANLTFSNGALEQFSLTGAVRALHTAPGFDIPGFSNIHGALNASLAGGQISIDSSDASILIPSLYDKPMHLGAAQGSVRWRFEPEGGVAMVDSVSLRSGKVGGRIDGQVRWAIGDEPPHIKATLEFDAAPYENLAPWLLVKDIPPAVLKWMAGAIRDANFDSVKVAVNASTDKLPFDAGPNGLTFKAKFHDAGLQYAEGWPLGNRLRGTFALAGPALSATLSGGDVLGTKLTSVTVGAPDLLASEPRVNVSGIFTGDSTHLMRYVRATPLRHGLGQELADLVISGPSKVDFSLTLVPSTGEVRALKGKVALTKNTLDSQRGLRFDDASGQLDFDRSGVTATALRATFLGAPVTLKSHLMPNAAREVALEGIADSAFLSALGRALQLLPSSANVDQPSGISPALFSGTAAWTAKLTLPSIRSTNSADTQGVTKPVISRLSVTSPLDGTRIALPGQFGKLAHTRRPLAVEVAFNSPTLRILTVRYGVDLRARVALMRPSDGLGTAWAIGRGHIRLGGSEAVLPTLP
ncbi:MAG: hypothetical protein ACI8PT_004284, partial [Gammaproteobacteria bacterium]